MPDNVKEEWLLTHEQQAAQIDGKKQHKTNKQTKKKTKKELKVEGQDPKTGDPKYVNGI